jgi:hypothetical protein
MGLKIGLGEIPEALLDMLPAADTNEAVFPATILYDEGWFRSRETRRS